MGNPTNQDLKTVEGQWHQEHQQERHHAQHNLPRNHVAEETEGKTDQSDDMTYQLKDTYEKLGIPEAEQKFLAGVGAQYDSEVVYHNYESTLEKQGVVFLSMDEGLAQYPDLVRKYFATVVPINDNKFAALNSAAWSGGSFIYVPKGHFIMVSFIEFFSGFIPFRTKPAFPTGVLQT